ncbi:helix-turn-helix transcriptional regulator [Actinoplanes sp. Pm04-4]|uniref:Helix-turn-helix transcriptional regulator n=1 Tax=Paractinoplanes pyxinae TaxID=2997416 RepID=A0ABT4B6A2_9ACTN|nr:helix-turn-helix transcriptional regulator [Actinoplanes pyxinae]MCY1142038.1 helix-turn-helix transcriptional regulator [Actinoplanes pyxinae]
MTDSPTFTNGGEEPVGVTLARWRKRRKISGQALGERVGMSQAKISRLETGVSAPDPHDIRVIAEGLELPADEVDRLVALAERSGDQLSDWHSTEPNLAGQQQFVRHLEAPAREVRVFQPAVVAGLLQTSQYARAILSAYRTELGDDQIADSALAVSEAVAARMQRSQVLDDPDRRFTFVLTESSLSNQMCPPAEMLAQIARIREVARQPNVSIRIVPEAATWPFPPLHGFELMGDRHVMVDLMNGSIVSRGSRRTIRQYERVFEAIELIAVSEIDAILDKHQKNYVELLAAASV